MKPLGHARPFLTAFLAALALGGCSRQVVTNSPQYQEILAHPGQPVQGDWVIERIGSDVDTLNPLTCQTTDGQWLTENVINEGLLQKNNFTLKLEPCLAESWEISPDQLTYTFHLRHGVKWHDGEPFTGDDVKFTFDKLMDPKVDAAPIRSYFTTVKSCDVLDPYTVRFVASERYFKTLEVIGTFMPICPRHVFAHGDPDFNKNDFGRHPIGTGPYQFVRWDTGAQIVVERNDDYWAGPIHYPKRMVFQVIEEPYVAAQLLKKGQIDVYDGVSPILWKHDLEGTRSMNHLRKIVYNFPSYSYLGFNLRQPLFSDIRVRHAIDLLMPRDQIINQIALGYATKTSGYDPPSAPSYNHDVPPTPYDPVQAQQLLAAAGWKNDHGDGVLYKDGKPLTFTLLYPSGNANAEKEIELIQESLQAQGIDVKLSRMEFAQLIDRVNDWRFDAVVAGWSLDINGDPWQLWNSIDADVKKSSNFIGYKSAVADQLMLQAKLEYDDDKRFAIYRHLQQVIHDDYPVCFLDNPVYILLVDDRFQDVKMFLPRPCFDMMSWWAPRALQKYGN
jgi:peptide/nickel transport system substrate-binding protein